MNLSKRDYPRPHATVPFDASVFERTGDARKRQQYFGRSNSARGKCSNHSQLEAVAMERRGNRWKAFCTGCVATGQRISVTIEKRMQSRG